MPTASLLTGLGLAGTAGLRAWLPLFIVGLLGRLHHLPLNRSFLFLERTDVLIVLGVFTTVEILGDKFIGLDHTLDAAGTAARPIAGALLAAASQQHLSPGVAMALSILAGGGISLAIHTGKASTRLKSSLLSVFHAGTGNSVLSLVEDAAAGGGIWLALSHPAIGAAVAIVFACLGLLMGWLLLRTGVHVRELMMARRRKKPGTVIQP